MSRNGLIRISGCDSIMMIEKIFCKKEFQIPVVFESDDFKDEISKFLTLYIMELKNAGVSEHVVESVKRFKRSCAYSLSNYLKGIHSNAFDNFEKALDSLQISNSKLLSTTLGSDVMFRGRENIEPKDYTDDEMYHIPLKMRSAISTERYSFPGLPCLYAGASVYTCWVEMNRPSLDRFQVATIRPTEEACRIRLYDLSNIPQRLTELQKYEWFKEDDYLLYWPLLAICSIKANHEGNPFKPEYIFPQFVLEHILKKKNDNEIVGIKYASIKASLICQKQFDDDWHTYVNYVFPSRSDSMSGGRCEILNERFPIENNRSGRELQILTRMLEIDDAKLKIQEEGEDASREEQYKTYFNNKNIYTRDGKKYSYKLSVFGMTEMAMLRESFDDLEEESMVMEDITSDDLDKVFIEN